MSSHSKRLWISGFFFIIFIATGIQTALFVHFAVSPLKTESQEGVIIEIHKGQSPHEISRTLQSSGVLLSDTDQQRFFWLGKILREWRKVKAGEYQISATMTPLQIFSVFRSGISIAHPVTIIEGANIYEIAAAIEEKKLGAKQDFLKLCKDPSFISALGFNPETMLSLEGFLFPNTYFFNKTLSVEDMIRQMIKQYRAHWGETEDNRARTLGLTSFQIMTLASMIEKETGAPQERPLIASVFYNRLKKKMRLQSDPTTIYGIWEHYQGNLHKSDLLDPSPYNTYFVPGLPAGPIGNPGKEAIQAALYPAESEYLYFVSHNDGTHQFSRTLQEHNLAVQKFQLDPKARTGKSWKNLKKS